MVYPHGTNPPVRGISKSRIQARLSDLILQPSAYIRQAGEDRSFRILGILNHARPIDGRSLFNWPAHRPIPELIDNPLDVSNLVEKIGEAKAADLDDKLIEFPIAGM